MVDLLTESFFEGQAAISAFEGPGGRWDITVHFAEAPDQASIRELVGIAAGEKVARDIAFDIVEAKDWVKATLEQLVPVRAERFIVHGQHDRTKVPPNKLGIEIEAALAFGTGHHGTTRGCLLLLDHVLKAYRPRRVLDLGTGTGVLAIAAAKALRIEVLASDIDPLSVLTARANARLNGAGNWVKTIRASGFSAPEFAKHDPFDLVLANILANPLRQMATPMATASGAIGVGRPVGLAAASGPKRGRGLPRARACPGAAHQDRRLEQPVAAKGRLIIRARALRAWIRSIPPSPILPDGQITLCHSPSNYGVSSPHAKNILLSPSGKSSLRSSRRPAPHEGRFAIVTNAGRDAMDADGAIDERRLRRTAKSCGPDTPTLVSSRRKMIPPATVAKEPGHRGERGGNR